LAGLGWQRSSPRRKDFRHIHDLAPTGELKTHFSQTQKHKEASQKQNANKVHKETAKETKEKKDSFLERVLATQSNTPSAAEALLQLKLEDRELVAKMTDTQEGAERRRQARASELNKTGVFSKNVNGLRAASMYRVELKRKMNLESLRRRRESEDKPVEHSLETNLMNLLDDLTVMDGGKRHPSKPAAKATRAHGSMHAQLEKTLLQAAVSTAAAKKARLSTEEVEGRRKRARRSVAAMIERYRREVEQRRNAILQSVGMPISAKDIPRDRVDESLFREAEELLEEEDQANLSESWKLEAAMNDPKRMHRKPNPKATAALVGSALERVQRVMARMQAQEEALAAAHERATETTKANSNTRAAQEGSSSGAESEEDVGRPDTVESAHSAATPTAKTKAAQSSSRVNTPQPESALAADQSDADQAATERPPEAPEPSTFTEGAEQVLEMANSSTYSGIPPKLPELVMDLHCTLAEQLQRRLERVWQVLRLPVMQKLDMVIKYTSEEFAHNLEAALQVWELAAAAVTEREQNLTILEELQKYKATGADVPGMKEEERRALAALQNATVYVLKADAQLMYEYGDRLMLEGIPYAQHKREPHWWHGNILGPQAIPSMP